MSLAQKFDCRSNAFSCSCKLESTPKYEIFNASGEGIARQPEAENKINETTLLITNFINIVKSIKTCGNNVCAQDFCKLDEVLLNSASYIEGIARQPEATPKLLQNLLSKILFYYNYFVLHKCCYNKKDLMEIIVQIFNKLLTITYTPHSCEIITYFKIKNDIIVLDETHILLPCMGITDPPSNTAILEGCDLKLFLVSLQSVLQTECNKVKFGDLIYLVKRTLTHINNPNSEITNNLLLTTSAHNNLTLDTTTLDDFDSSLSLFYKNIFIGLPALLNNFVSANQCHKLKDKCQNRSGLCCQRS